MDRTAPDLLREISIRLSETAQNLERIGKRAKMASDARAPRQAVDDARYVSRASMLGVALAPMGQPVPASNIAGTQRVLNVTPDVPDTRDRLYAPVLRDLSLKKMPPSGIRPLNQGQEGACTGFALAAAINVLNGERRNNAAHLTLPQHVSPRMLYEMAKLHDEWLGEGYSGSSLRGAMKGFFHNGVCSLAAAPYNAAEVGWTLSIAQAKDARLVSLGAYYRLHPDATHYHAALNEVDVICVSARVHEGWRAPVSGKIVQQRTYIGGHAFAIVGYDESGFLVLNSWGETWGGGGVYPAGVAHWSYEDWAENVLDAWVMRLSVPTPQAFHLVRNRSTFGIQAEATTAERASAAPRRDQVVGHIMNIDDGLLQSQGAYATPLPSLVETAKRIGKPEVGQQRFQHVLIYAHGGLNSLEDGAARAAVLREPLKRNGIYPIFLLWGTDFPNEFQDAIVGGFRRVNERAGAGFSDFTDKAIELLVGKIGRAVWREIKRDAETAFDPARRKDVNALAAMTAMLKEIPTATQGGPKLHLVGHSAGSILLGQLLGGLKATGASHAIDTMQLLAPACTVPFFDKQIRPFVGSGGPLGVRQLDIFNLKDEREQSDTVLGAYQKSLLYFVSRALEEDTPAALLGMQTYSHNVQMPPGGRIGYAGLDPRTDAKNHGDFDNDFATMTSVVTTILGRPQDKATALEPADLRGY